MTDRALHLKDARRLARRKHRLSTLVKVSDDGQESTWRGLIYGNEWRLTHNEVKSLLRNGARKPV